MRERNQGGVFSGLTRTEIVVLAVALVAGAALRLYRLGGPSLWTDELVTWWAASAPSLGDTVSRSVSCTPTPAFSFLIHRVFIGVLGPGEWALRLPSALAGIAAIPLVFGAGRRMFGPGAGIASALVLAFHPFHLWVSTDARPYSLAVLFAAGSTWAFSEALRGGRLAALAAWVICSAGLLQTQYVFLPLFGAQIAAYLAIHLSGARPALAPTKALLPTGLIALLAAPLLPQIARVAGGSSFPLRTMSAELPPGLVDLLIPAMLALALLITLAASVLANRPPREAPVFPEVQSETGRGWDLLTLCFSIALPSLALGVAGVVLEMPSITLSRYSAASIAPAALWLGWILTRPTWRGGKWIFASSFLLLVVGTQVAPLLATGRPLNVNATNEDWRGAERFLRAELQPGDLILLRSGLAESDGLFDGSFPEACREYLRAPLSSLYLGSVVDPTLLPSHFAAPPYPPSYEGSIGKKLLAHDRIWVVMIQPPEPLPYFQSVVAYVRTATGRPFAPVRRERFGYVSVSLLAPGA